MLFPPWGFPLIFLSVYVRLGFLREFNSMLCEWSILKIIWDFEGVRYDLYILYFVYLPIRMEELLVFKSWCIRIPFWGVLEPFLEHFSLFNNWWIRYFFTYFIIPYLATVKILISSGIWLGCQDLKIEQTKRYGIFVARFGWWNSLWSKEFVRLIVGLSVV